MKIGDIYCGHVLIAGDPTPWMADRDAKVRASATRPGCFESESLCRNQEQQSARGRRELVLVLSLYGWTLRYRSGLQNNGIIYRSGRFDIGPALACGLKCVADDPTTHELYVTGGDLWRAIKDGHDLLALREYFDALGLPWPIA